MFVGGMEPSGDGSLARYLRESATRHPENLAVVEPGGGAISYADLDRLTDRVCAELHRLGVQKGDRVGVNLSKTIDSVAAVFGILKAGAAYVPVDPGSPAERNAFIFSDCEVAALFVSRDKADELRREMAERDFETAVIELDRVGGGEGLARAVDGASEASEQPLIEPSDLAYILYTSGSTGNPKGVMLTHENAMSFVDWCSDVFEPGPEDRFSSHAPFHFDLSVLDLYLSIKHGGTLYLINEELSKNPAGMVRLIADEKLTIWYSTPSVLTVLLQFGKLDKEEDLALRHVLFAGEVFPVKHLRELIETVPEPRYFNLYGPTETNVCTFYEIPAGGVPEERTAPYPIGGLCPYDQGRVTARDGTEVAAGGEGELWISGASVMQGYWNLPERNEQAFVQEGAVCWYRTGDLVVEEEPGCFTYVGRADRMVKRRGYRIEPGEIEAAMYRHPDIAEAAALPLSDSEGVTIRCFYSTRTTEPLSMIDLKLFCSDNLPGYMIPDTFSFLAELPKTSTDKIDYQGLKEIE